MHIFYKMSQICIIFEISCVGLYVAFLPFGFNQQVSTPKFIPPKISDDIDEIIKNIEEYKPKKEDVNRLRNLLKEKR